MDKFLKQRTTVRDAGGDIQGRPANIDITSDAILFKDVNKSTLNNFFQIFNFFICTENY